MVLSKSSYMQYLQHPALLWLSKNDKYKLPPIDEATQNIFDEGNLFEEYAEKIYPNAVKIGFDIRNFDSYKNMPERTKTAINSGAEVILQGRLEASNITCIFDVLKKVEKNVYDLIEIKSSSSAKLEHIYDLAFQKLVLEEAGLQVRNVSVIHVNSDYVRRGEIEVNKLVSESDITAKVAELDQLTREQVKEAFDTVLLAKCPDLSLKNVNALGVQGTKWKDQWLETYEYLIRDISETSIYKLCRLSSQQVEVFEDLNIEEIDKIPTDLPDLHPKQIAQIETTKSKVPIIDKEKISDFIDSFQYPLYFFDYETLSSVIPYFDGMQPYKDYPFQYSLHILPSPDSEIIHKEYLHTESTNPVPPLMNQLKKDIAEKGTILSWNMRYEKSCNERVASTFPEYKDFLEEINERMQDLMTPFYEMWYVDWRFHGSASIKNVLPVIVPELSYKELEVSDGLKARRTWTNTFLKSKNTWNKEKVTEDLLAYCKLDTLAMVKIFEKLKKL